uniref:Uncharacterized protein n=1 Tax=Bactrocera dorsalis TaxID=27457 RepID=A0A034WT46_BACDO
MSSAPYNGSLRERVERCLGLDKWHFNVCLLEILAAANVEYQITFDEKDNHIQKRESDEMLLDEEDDEMTLRVFGPKLSRNKSSFSDCCEYLQQINEWLQAFP